MDDELLTIAQTAKYLKLSEKTIRRLISESRLIASKVGNRTWRIKASDIENYIQTNNNGKKGVDGE